MVEDEFLLLELFEEYVKLIPNVCYLGSCSDGHVAYDEIVKNSPDVLILDIRLPKVNGLEILRKLRVQLPEMKIIIFSGSLDPSSIKICIDTNAHGFVEKSYGLEELKKAILAVISGKIYYTEGAEKIRKTLM
jgi:DNA-binding NarL/FixJ family response regulator